MVSINFWIKDSGNYCSHSNGLNEEQVKALQELKEGDRLIIYKNTKKKETDSSLTLKVFKREPN